MMAARHSNTYESNRFPRIHPVYVFAKGFFNCGPILQLSNEGCVLVPETIILRAPVSELPLARILSAVEFVLEVGVGQLKVVVLVEQIGDLLVKIGDFGRPQILVRLKVELQQVVGTAEVVVRGLECANLGVQAADPGLQKRDVLVVSRSL